MSRSQFLGLARHVEATYAHSYPAHVLTAPRQQQAPARAPRRRRSTTAAVEVEGLDEYGDDASADPAPADENTFDDHNEPDEPDE